MTIKTEVLNLFPQMKKVKVHLSSAKSFLRIRRFHSFVLLCKCQNFNNQEFQSNQFLYLWLHWKQGNWNFQQNLEVVDSDIQRLNVKIRDI